MKLRWTQIALTEFEDAHDYIANQNFGVAAAYAVVVMLVSLAATLVYLRALRTPREQIG